MAGGAGVGGGHCRGLRVQPAQWNVEARDDRRAR